MIKIINELNKCKECQQIFNAKNILSRHIGKVHGHKEYYDKWIKNDNEGTCKICNIPTKFLGLRKGYRQTCSKKHHLELTYLILKNKCIENYNVDNPMKNKYLINKRRKNNITKYGVVHPMKLEKNIIKLITTNLIKYKTKCPLQNKKIHKKTINTNINKYGVEHHMKNNKIKEKQKKTNITKYGIVCILQRHDIIEKIKKNNLNIYGVEHYMQIKKIFDKQQLKSFKYKSFKNTNLIYQSSYELDFLTKYYDIIPNIERGKTIKYIYKNKNRVYYSDFFIPSLNLIVEIKNKFLYERDFNKIKSKEYYTIKNGYNYIIIIDKNYNKFNRLLKMSKIKKLINLNNYKCNYCN